MARGTGSRHSATSHGHSRTAISPEIASALALLHDGRDRTKPVSDDYCLMETLTSETNQQSGSEVICAFGRHGTTSACERFGYTPDIITFSTTALYCRPDDRADVVVQVAPPLICGQAKFDEMEQILRHTLTEAQTLV
jgi:hypothetical protein